jgi:hypothetical protein
MLFGTASRTIHFSHPCHQHNVVKSIVKASDFVECRNQHAIQGIKPENVSTSEYPGGIGASMYNGEDKTKASSSVKTSEELLIYHYRYTSSKALHFHG